jgi:hypothetical protein
VTFALVNANKLTSAAVAKAERLWELIADTQYFAKPPDLVAVTEVGGAAGSRNLNTVLGSNYLAQYNVYWSQRATANVGSGSANSKDHAGGGIALLVHKRMGMRARDFNFDISPDDDQRTDGHVRVWQLDPDTPRPGKHGRGRGGGLGRSMVVTVAYVPPASANQWGRPEMRDALFRVIRTADKAIQELRHTLDVFAVTLGHLNAPDGGCYVDMRGLRLEPEEVPKNRKRCAEATKTTRHAGDAGMRRASVASAYVQGRIGKVQQRPAGGGSPRVARSGAVWQDRPQRRHGCTSPDVVLSVWFVPTWKLCVRQGEGAAWHP